MFAIPCFLLLCYGTASTSLLRAQAQSGSIPQTKLQRLASHFDLGLSATGELNGSVSGVVQNALSGSNGTLTEKGSTTVGVLATIRAEKSPYVGGEFNFRYSRYAQDFTFAGGQTASFRAQNTANEYTVGYIARPPHRLFGTQPFAGGGAGTIEFKPTRNGGGNLPVQARAAYYYTAGVEAPLYGDLIGFRAGFRQVFYLAPDFGQNYLLIKKHTSTAEPTIGFTVHF